MTARRHRSGGTATPSASGPSRPSASPSHSPSLSGSPCGSAAGSPCGSAAGSPSLAADAFDLLHGRHARALVRQTFLLCGGHGLARRSVAHAFRLAWRRWPQIAVDPHPEGWVRAAAHRHALAPWRHLGPVRLVRRVRAMRHVPPGDRALLDALLRLPRPYRAALLLHDGLGLSLGDTAAETEAGTAATAGRLRHARAALAASVPELGDAAPEELPHVTASLVRQLAAPQPARLPRARRMRRGGQARSWCATAAALGLVAAVASAAVMLVVYGEKRQLSPLHVPKPPSASLGPERQPGRLQPMIRDGAGPRTAPVRTPVPVRTVAPVRTDGPVHADGPAPLRHTREAGPFVARA